MKALLIGVLSAFTACCYGQGYISYDYIPTSTLKDELGNNYGSGSMQIASMAYNVPLLTRQDSKGRPVAWSLGSRVAYGTLDNHGQAKQLNPGNIFNGSLNLTHIRPLHGKWNLIATIGGGVYTPIGEIDAQSILANSGIVFVYQIAVLRDLPTASRTMTEARGLMWH